MSENMIYDLKFISYETCYMCNKLSEIEYIYNKEKDQFDAWCEKCGGPCIPTFYISKERGMKLINKLVGK